MFLSSIVTWPLHLLINMTACNMNNSSQALFDCSSEVPTTESGSALPPPTVSSAGPPTWDKPQDMQICTSLHGLCWTSPHGHLLHLNN